MAWLNTGSRCSWKRIRKGNEMAVKYKTLHSTAIESNAEGTPQTTWTTADDVPQQHLLKYLCSEGYSSGGMACASCESQCAFGRRYLALGMKTETERLRNERNGVRVYRGAEFLGEFSSYTKAESELKLATRGCISKAMRLGQRYLDYTFERVAP